ncbi:MAG: class I SAM-dependent methyltransferase [Candidatus Brocadiia bacterium]|jgi:hypothetical protein|nr:class I SAM-dependent methyltransferase [Candidatus Brocadiia bacterium]
MSKHDVLTEVEMSRFKFRKHMLRRIDSCCARTGVPRTEFNILDYGCGRGRAVAWLRASGYNAFGVDIDPEPVRNGRDLLLGRGEDPDAVLRVIGREGRTSFPNGFFHFVFSQQVMEHVEDLGGMVEELAGITRPGGMGVHAYPAHRQMMERHLLMPAVHWVPKGALRKACIALCVACGLGTALAPAPGRGVRPASEHVLRLQLPQDLLPELRRRPKRLRGGRLRGGVLRAWHAPVVDPVAGEPGGTVPFSNRAV